MRPSEVVVKAAFKKRLNEIKGDIEAGKIKFYNPPPVWTEELLNKTALTCILYLIDTRAKWN